VIVIILIEDVLKCGRCLGIHVYICAVL